MSVHSPINADMVREAAAAVWKDKPVPGLVYQLAGRLNALIEQQVANNTGEVLGNGHPDWPAELVTFGERKAYQMGVAAARVVDGIRAVRAERDAYKWAYEYLQSRMESIGRPGWAHDCDGEIEARIAQTAENTSVRNFTGIGHLEQTGYIPPGSAAEREAQK